MLDPLKSANNSSTAVVVANLNRAYSQDEQMVYSRKIQFCFINVRVDSKLALITFFTFSFSRALSEGVNCSTAAAARALTPTPQHQNNGNASPINSSRRRGHQRKLSDGRGMAPLDDAVRILQHHKTPAEKGEEFTLKDIRF